MLKKYLLTLGFLFLTGLVIGQTINYTDGDCVVGSLTLSLTGNDGTRNIYTASFGMTTITIQYNPGMSRWEIDQDGFVLMASSQSFVPNPPDLANGMYFTVGINCMISQLDGDGTQTSQGGDPCAMSGGDSDNDGVCDDFDVCPGGDDLADIDGDHIPDDCDPNPMIPDGVLLATSCFTDFGNPTPDTVAFLLSGTFANRNVYSNNIIQLDIIFNPTLSQWEIRSQGMASTLFYTNSFASAPNPPDQTTSAWITTGAAGCTNSIVLEGPATQSTLGCDLAITNIDSTGGACAGSIIVTATRSTIGGISYNITGPIDSTNTMGMFTDIPVGSYTITVRDSTFPDGVCVVTGTGTTTSSDGTSPSITCPANMMVDNDPSLCSAVVNYTLPTFSDNCPGATLSLVSGLGSGGAFPVGISTETYRVTDLSGNSTQCSFTITVEDTEVPTIMCPTDITVNNDMDDCGAVVTFSATGSDNCSMPMLTYSPASGSFFAVGSTLVTATATDGTGLTAMCTFNVIVNDTQVPTIICPSDMTVNNDPSQCGAMVTFSVGSSDNCTVTSTVSTPPSGSIFPVGSTVVSTTVMDANGNSNTCNFMVTVNDVELPTISCQSDTIVYADPGVCTAVVSFNAPIGIDNCPGATTTLTSMLGSGSMFPAGNSTVEYTVMDAAGNTAQCSFMVTVLDTVPPVIVCPNNIVRGSGLDTCGTMVNYSLPTATDLCPGNIEVTIVSGISSGAVFPVGVSTIIFMATDSAGNTSQCSMTISVTDTQAPTVMTQQATIYLDSMGSATLLTSDIDDGSSDNCALVLSLSQSVFGCMNVSTNPNVVNLIGNDGVNAPVMTPANVTVLDTIRPLLVCKDTMILFNFDFEATVYVADLISSLSDACGIMDTTLSQSFFTSDDVGTQMITVTATDNNGNVQTCVAAVTFAYDPASIPTLGQWSLIILCIFMMVVGVLYNKRKTATLEKNL